MVVERPKTPIVQYAVSRYGGEPMGGIQGPLWYVRAAPADADGDVANQFMDERDVGGEDDDDRDDAFFEGGATVSGGKSGIERARTRALVEVAGAARDVRLKPASELDSDRRARGSRGSRCRVKEDLSPGSFSRAVVGSARSSTVA